MTEDDKKPSEEAAAEQTAPETPANDDAAAQAPEPMVEATDGSALEGEDVVLEPDPVIVLAEENAALKDRLMRTLADLENLRKRAQREREDALKYGMQKFAKDICDVADNLKRALDSTDADSASDETKAVLEGVRITRDSVKQVFERHGVKEIEAENQRFDPNLHEAMTEIDVPGAPPSTCIQVIETGYTLHDRLLRPARVIITKSAGKAGQKVDTSA